jgi:hypothetical protein
MFNGPNRFNLPRCRAFWLRTWFTIISSIFSASALAQTSATGALTGIVVDPSGAVIPSVSVQISNESGGFTQSTSSNASVRAGTSFS